MPRPLTQRTRSLARCAFLFLVTVSAAFAAPEPIRIGHYASLTGKEASFGQAARKGVELALAEVNARGGVLGRPLELYGEDIQSKSGEAATVVKKLITRDKVVAVLGGNASTNSLEAAPICQNYRVPMIAISSTNPKVTAAGNYIFRTCFIDPFQGAVLAKFARESLKVRRVALLTSVSAPYSVGLSQVFREKFTAAGGEIVADLKYSEGDKDFKAQLTALRAARPDAIAATGYYAEAALICQQARALGLTVPIFGGDGWEAPQLIELGGAAVEGTYYSTHYSAESPAPEVRNFIARFKAHFNGETPDAVAALGYDTVMLLADAITRAGTTAEPALRNALAATKDFPGVTGATTMDAQRNAAKPAVVVTVNHGRIQFVESVKP
ncbi:MAG: ABC transporter substrate-binding protein [Verrucomicrobia bacterium]|nr:ABC transporter substrate-binding protein [Verrucomicrobiota bacterium]